jgi:hypothetical protein
MSELLMKMDRCLAFGFLVILVAGCGAMSDRRPTAPVKVSVTYKGKPVEGALVQFISIEKPQPAVGNTDASGSCSLQTYQANDGAIIGMNSVTITKNEMDTKNARPVNPEDADLIGVTPPPVLKSLIPKKYASPATSGIQADVVRGKNEFTYDLTD